MLASQHISKALPLANSIDEFIDTQKENKKIAFCGKLAIIRSILNDEKRSKLYFEQTQQGIILN